APLTPPPWTNSPHGVSLPLPPICKYCTYDLEFITSPSPTSPSTSSSSSSSPTTSILPTNIPPPTSRPQTTANNNSEEERKTPPPRPLPKWMSTLPSNRRKPTPTTSRPLFNPKKTSSPSFSIASSSSPSTPKHSSKASADAVPEPRRQLTVRKTPSLLWDFGSTREGLGAIEKQDGRIRKKSQKQRMGRQGLFPTAYGERKRDGSLERSEMVRKRGAV
ncbi:MAG: hypothetical protein Q9225_008099, partial [Loekoesia sp. 1 TL-2023]